MELPVAFTDRMQRLLGEEFPVFMSTYANPRHFGLRVNTLKISVEDFISLTPFHLTKIPWISNGFCYEREDDPARHPFYYAGLYYLQEPSAMTPANILQVTPGEYVLDLCAAPGGKATALAAKLQGQGLLVANDISASRAKALLKNLEVFGAKNTFVTNAVPKKLADQFEETFDKVLVDAPCSGEGMFRKDIANAKAWSLDKVSQCAKIQREITSDAVRMLRPGGLMLYSTCTFAPEENEGTIAYLLQKHPEMEVVELPWYEGFCEGMPQTLQTDADGNYQYDLLNECDLACPVSEEILQQLKKCARIFPHKMDGEGHFLALLRKKGELPGMHKKASVKWKKPSREETKVLEDFLKDVAKEFFTGDVMAQIDCHNSQVYYIPEPPQIRQNIPFLRNGLYLGELKKNRFEPSQSFAMALKKTEYKNTVDLPSSDPRVRKYLCGETIMVDDLVNTKQKGWQLVCTDGYPLGWGKLANGTMKNKYHPGWRMVQ